MTVRPRDGSKLSITLPEPQPTEYWWEPGSSSPASIEEERGLSEYDCGYLDLGSETPASTSTSDLVENLNLVENWAGTRLAALHTPTRRSPSHQASSPVTNNPSKFNKYAVDRDCGICFEYAVVPCRTLCCGKIFCTEHLADWLHGPEAEGRCPNCENACSLEGGTLSLASSSSQGRRDTLTQAIPGHFYPSPLTIVQRRSNDTSTSSRDGSNAKMTTSVKNSLASSPSSVTITPSTCSSTVDCSETTVYTSKTKTTGEQHHTHATFPKEGPLNSSFCPPWGVLSRLFSIMIFLMFLYKLRS